MGDTLALEEAKELVRFCAAGRLYEVEDWIRAGRSLKTPPELKKTPLAIALKTGFYSLIELLLRHETSQQAKNDVLAEAVRLRRPELVELAAQHGADTKSVKFAEVLECWDKRIMAFFLERGADPVEDFAFAWALHDKIRTALWCYLECKRRRPDLVPQLQDQLDIALRQFCRDGNLKWVSLLMWAGGNPRSKGADDRLAGRPGDVHDGPRRGVQPWHRRDPQETEARSDNWTI